LASQISQYDPDRLAKLINAGRAADVIVRLAEVEQARAQTDGHAPLLITFPGNPEPVGVPSSIAPRVVGAVIASLQEALEEAIADARN
jgi:hypothetical protein